MTTARELIKSSLRLIEVLQMSEAPTADEAQDALSALNAMLDSWSNDSLNIYQTVLESFPLVGNKASYTIGTGQDFSTSRPMAIVDAFIRESLIDYPMAIVNDSVFDTIPNKTTGTNLPYYLNYNNGYPNGTIRVYPTPTVSNDIYIRSEKVLTQITNLDAEIAFPPGWERALKYNLAVEISPEYGKEPKKIVLETAAKSLGMIKSAVLRSQPQTPAITRRRYDIRSDE